MYAKYIVYAYLFYVIMFIIIIIIIIIIINIIILFTLEHKLRELNAEVQSKKNILKSVSSECVDMKTKLLTNKHKLLGLGIRFSVVC